MVFATALSAARTGVSGVFLAVAWDAGLTRSGADLRGVLFAVGAFFASAGVFTIVLWGAVCATVFTDFLRDAFFAVSTSLFLLLLSVTMDALLW
ncbi:MAG: hypothetical protein LBU11_03895 [Zoogloeaceae bacterium]|jgi:hypothetical protein|nr:hypothetical protein [Zoogloeaceae bacterium]